MNVYLDDDLDSNLLIDLLLRFGHQVVSPRKVKTRSASDEQHLRYAAAHGLVLLTANAGDFFDLYNEWVAQKREHSGILVVYRENNPVRDMSFEEIARAVTRLEKSGLSLQNTIQNLNFWKAKKHRGL